MAYETEYTQNEQDPSLGSGSSIEVLREAEDELLSPTGRQKIAASEAKPRQLIFENSFPE